MIHVALASVYPTETEARAALTNPANYAPDYARYAAGDAPYHGIWTMPSGAIVHLFTDHDTELLTADGWTRTQGADCHCPGEWPHPERGKQPGAAAHRENAAGQPTTGDTP